MNAYMISYDLRNRRNYQNLYDAIKSYGTYAQVLESVWIVKTNSDHNGVYNHLVQYMDNDDGLFITKPVRNETIWQNVNCSYDWLNNSL